MKIPFADFSRLIASLVRARTFVRRMQLQRVSALIRSEFRDCGIRSCGDIDRDV